MKRLYFLTALAAFPWKVHAADAQALEKRVDALEYASYANTVTWNGFFESRYDSVKIKPDGGTEDKFNLHRWLLGLDFKARPSDNLSFFGRVTASTLYNPGAGEGSANNSSLTGARGYNDSVVRVERAFFNYEPIKNLSLTVGRLPTLDGPPNHLYDGLPRQGSYPKLIYAAILDGYALTYNLNVTDNQNLAIRFVNSPFSIIRPEFGGDGVISYKRPKVSTDPAGTEREDNDLVDISGAMLDYTATGTGIARNINVIVQYLGWQDFKFLSMKWDYSRYAIYFELEDIMNMGFNFYGGTLSTTNKTEGGLTVGVNPATGLPIQVGIMSNEADATVKGQGTLLGLGYRVPVAAVKNPLVGFESISSDKGYLIFDASVKEPFDFYGVRGSANQVYATFDLTPGLKLRVGQVSSNPKYESGLTVGEPKENKSKNSSFYANFRLDY